MKTWKPRAQWVEDLALRALQSDPVPEGTPMPPDVEKWLAQLSLLYGVPFAYLVPDWRMMPSESIRFFVVDPNWVARLLDGALGIAETSTASVLQLERARPRIHDRVARAALRIRSALRGVAAPAQGVQGGTISGFVLRSAVVSGWPGLEVHGYAGQQRDLLPILRMDRPSPDVLLVLFNGLPNEVDLMEPPEGLHFGVIGESARRGKARPRSKGAADEALVVDLRYLGPGGHPAGQTIPNATAPVGTRGGSYANVVDVASLATALTSQLTQLNQLGPFGFTSAEFAIQMVKSAEVQPYGTPPTRPRRRSSK